MVHQQDSKFEKMNNLIAHCIILINLNSEPPFDWHLSVANFVTAELSSDINRQHLKKMHYEINFCQENQFWGQ